MGMIFSINIESVLFDLDLEYTTNVDVSSGIVAGVPPKSKKHDVRSNHLFLRVGHRSATCHTICDLDEKYKLRRATAIGIEALLKEDSDRLEHYQ
jgi:hypothetical protein